MAYRLVMVDVHLALDPFPARKQVVQIRVEQIACAQQPARDVRMCPVNTHQYISDPIQRCPDA